MRSLPTRASATSRRRVDEELARAHGAVLRHNPLYELDALTQDVVAGGICLGRVMTLAKNHPFGERDSRRLRPPRCPAAQGVAEGRVPLLRGLPDGPLLLARLLDDERPTPCTPRAA